jgi:cell division protein FtsN
MPRNEDGEFELILGNKQLLSVFFIVVTLLAVFFAMGFIMGRSVNPVAEAHKVDNGPSDKPIVVDAKPSASSGTETASVRQVEIKSPIEAEVKKPEPKASEPKAEAKKAPEPPAKKDPEPKKAEPKVEAKKPEPKPAEPASAGKPSGGTYLQVAAVGKAEAELVSEVLAKKGFRTAITAVEGKTELHRVLVGPVKAGSEQAKAMDDLKAAGFKPFPRKL